VCYIGIPTQAFSHTCLLIQKINPTVPNVIVFGETGAGKSSLLNMLDGDRLAGVSSRADGVTCSNECFKKTIKKSTFHVFDTVGLNEGNEGTVPPRSAIAALSNLIHSLENGVSLLVYVIRAPRISAVVQQNYRMFCNIICDKQVPIVIVVTGLELENDMDSWWQKNRVVFDANGMSFAGFACITATPGKLGRDGKPIFHVEYMESKKKLERLIYYSYRQVPWRMETLSWLAATAARVREICAKVFGFKPKAFDEELKRTLSSYQLSDQEKKELTTIIKKARRRRRD
jgi:predicted GTPase